ncbi:hypothetical protein BATDEDRAFT_9358 [Batrachochytrium dendrobatidis JAM81]|uniref:Heat shock protein 70 n=2 Tax=Batrachochytrium dendrobatidis TaxID=109871 RepID=F4NXG3_BATDJ|nr:uncharacterized protein BATDEDRAFT_9358 [Batrachochytrium dendrobatidis JAM81]KAJ8328372.1 adenyl-nucleotide exchange factor sse1 [Batrachochytrium dendrobatidis]OAJ39897.1 hypothetical protein BDEG_23695 [Batrachochytrium dendrobatidis JEL423]EGF82677.1 hypothetical protein BATDEDRAFT_9358 [Batrachochytrium dendrobatidis JAM81]KAK5673432.1 adenyl-nucleotide exchange factor sse1 [Batrachochytrium dendrobatidis]OAJ39898.1 hypothetical protein, variant [Batrachochytrium dendrobatidis JEL423]|eukprot:XP_006676499.1 hypothetical protein BATDEDRAFT_9358 [Batrachochytrium dendrobatidis JAM81]
MSVVGIDFGNLNTVVAVARNRGIDVITNETSNRATPSLVSFGEKQRFLGEAAKTQEVSSFKNTVGGLKRVAGRPFSDPEVMAKEKRFINSNIVEGESGDAAASVMFQNEVQTFSFAQIASMFLVRVREFTSAEIKAPVTDCVISCPTWFTDAQRRALIASAEIAGLNCLKLMNDTTAAALGYGITKTDLPDPVDPKVKPRVVVFVDLGHSSYQVAVVSLVKGKLIIKGTAWDRNLGGRDIDDAITNHFIKEFDAKYKMDINSNAKAVFRLRQGAERAKKILSANAVTTLNVECLLDDKDVSGHIKRAEFEEWISPLVQRLIPPLQAALDAAGVTPDEVDFVELVGGSTRVPLVKETLAKFFGGSLEGQNKLATTLNQDEAVARGCALQCAIISPVFKVREFATQEWNGYPIELQWDPSQAPPPKKSGEPVTTSMEAFALGNAIPSSKIMTFVRAIKDEELDPQDETVSLEIRGEYGAAALARDFPMGVGANIGTWTIKGIKKYPSCVAKDGSAKATIKVKAKLDINCQIVLEAANQIEELVIPIDESEKIDAATVVSPTGDAMDADVSVTTEISKSGKTKKVIKRHDLVVIPHTHSASVEQIAKWTAAEGQMYASDRLVIDTAEKRNTLEEYVYEVRSKLEMAWSEFVTDADRSAFLAQLNDTESWLYGEGEEATKSIYVEKLNELKKAGDPIAYKYLQSEERPSAEKAFREYVNSVVISIQAEDDRYAHISKDDLDRVLNECKAKLDWLNAAIGKQNETPKHVDLHVTVEQINMERNALQHLATPILSKPKPAPKKEEPKPAEPATDAKEEVPEAAKDTPAAENMDLD